MNIVWESVIIAITSSVISLLVYIYAYGNKANRLRLSAMCFALLVSFSTYFLVYVNDYGTEFVGIVLSIVKSVESTKRVLIGNSDLAIVNSSPLDKNTVIQLVFMLSHLMIMAFAIFYIVKAIFKELFNILVVRFGSVKRLYVFTNYELKDRIAIKGIIENCGSEDYKILILYNDTQLLSKDFLELKNEEDANGVLFIKAKGSYLGLLEHLGCFNEKKYSEIMVMILNADDRMLSEVSMLKTLSKNLSHVSVYYHIRNASERMIIQNAFRNLDCTLHVFDESSLVVRSYLTENRPDITDNLTYILIGSLDKMEAYIKQLVPALQFCKSLPTILLLDVSNSDRAAFIHAETPEIFKSVNFEYRATTLYSEKFYEILNRYWDLANCVIIDLDDDHAAAQCMVHLKNWGLRVQERLPIKMHLRLRGLDVEPLKGEETSFLSISSYGSHEKLYSYDVLVKESLDNIAKQLHEDYFLLYGGMKWYKLDEFTKESNRNAASSFPSLLAIAGYHPTKMPEYAITTQEELIRGIGADTLWLLAEYEHKRWNAFHYVNGWVTLPYEGQIASKIPYMKAHACLVNWDGLNEVSRHFGRDYKQMDFDNIVRLVNAYAKQGVYFSNKT